MAKVEPRNLAPFLRTLRNILLGRKLKNALRFPDYVSPRTQPAPNLPPGPSAKLAGNYYCSRDGRRESVPPTVVMEVTGTKQITSGTPKAEVTQKKLPFPGEPYNAWTLKK